METKIAISLQRDPKTQPKDDDRHLKLLWFDLAPFGPSAQFFICCAAVFVFYLAYGFMQELIFTLEGFKPYGWYLTLVQFLYYSIFGWIETVFKGNYHRKIPIKTYTLIALMTLGTMGFSNSSLGYLNYPTQVIFKCCKLVPVLVGSVIIQGKKYSILDYLAAILMCFGLTMFILADSETSPIFDIVGVFMISMALLCDAVIGNIQEKAMKAFQASNTEVVLYSYFIGFIYLFVVMLISGHFFSGFIFCLQYPQKTYGYALLFSLTGYIGIQAVLTLVRTSGAPTAATVTTARKAVTMIFSFILFSKPFVLQYLWSGCIVLAGIYLNVCSKKYPNFSLKSLSQYIKWHWRNKTYTKYISTEV